MLRALEIPLNHSLPPSLFICIQVPPWTGCISLIALYIKCGRSVFLSLYVFVWLSEFLSLSFLHSLTLLHFYGLVVLFSLWNSENWIPLFVLWKKNIFSKVNKKEKFQEDIKTSLNYITPIISLKGINISFKKKRSIF